jgi:cytochrome c biogenesis protein CcmG/thiol:disulfide interchange protein DsbE
MHEPSAGPPPHQAIDPSSARRLARRIIARVGLAFVIGAAVVLSTLRLGGSTPARPTDAGLQAIASAVEGIRVGESAPDFVDAGGREPLLTDLDGNPIRLDDFAGKPLWIVFWATWCTPCQQEAIDIRAAYHSHLDDRLVVLAIDSQEPAAAVRKYALGHDLDYPIGLDPAGLVKDLYGAWGLPSHFFLDGSRVIRDRYFGQLTREVMEEHLRAIVGS